MSGYNSDGRLAAPARTGRPPPGPDDERPFHHAEGLEALVLKRAEVPVEDAVEAGERVRVMAAVGVGEVHLLGGGIEAANRDPVERGDGVADRADLEGVTPRDG